MQRRFIPSFPQGMWCISVTCKMSNNACTAYTKTSPFSQVSLGDQDQRGHLAG